MTTSTAPLKCASALYQIPPSRTRESVLVVPHGDGWLEIFAGKHVDVHVAPMPFAPNHEVLAERLFELRLPPRYRELYWPDLRRAVQMWATALPDDIARRDCDVAFVRAIREAFAEPQDEVVAWIL